MSEAGASSEPGHEAILAVLVQKTEGPQPMRRLFHTVSGVAMAAALGVFGMPLAVATSLLGAILVGMVILDAVRLSSPRLNVLFFKAFPSLASPREARRPASSTWYVLGVFIALVAFPGAPVLAGILVLALADPAASLLGRRWGRHPLGHGSLEGSAVFFAVAFATLLVFVAPLWAVAVALLVAVVEPIPWPLDDNFTIPVVVAFCLWGLDLA